MTPETRGHLDKAREYLTKARGMLEVMHYSDEAVRAASSLPVSPSSESAACGDLDDRLGGFQKLANTGSSGSIATLTDRSSRVSPKSEGHAYRCNAC